MRAWFLVSKAAVTAITRPSHYMRCPQHSEHSLGWRHQLVLGSHAAASRWAETARHGRQFSSWVNTSIVPGQAATLHCGIIQDPKKDRKEAGNKENLVKKLCFFLPQWISAKMMHVPRPSIIFQRSCWDFLILSNNYTYKIIGRSNQMQN